MPKKEMREAGPQALERSMLWTLPSLRQVEKPPVTPAALSRVCWQLSFIFQKMATEMLWKKFAIPECPRDPTLQISPQSTAMWKKYFKHGLFTILPIIIQLTRIRLEAEPSNRLLQLRPERAGGVFIWKDLWELVRIHRKGDFWSSFLVQICNSFALAPKHCS